MIHFDPFWSILDRLIKSDQKINKNKNLMIYFNDHFIRNQIWSSLIYFDPFWTDQKIENWKSDDIFQWLFHQKLKMWKKWKIWFNLSGKIQKSILRAFARKQANDCFIRNPNCSSLIHFDPFWTDLIKSDQTIKYLTIYFNYYFIRSIIW